MHIKILFVLALAMSVHAQNLNEIITSFKTSKKVQSLKNQANTKIANNNGVNTYAAPEIGLGVVHAESSEQSHTWNEYAVGISQTLAQPFASQSKTNMSKMLNASVRQSLKHEIHILESQTISKYYTSCIAKELEEKSQVLLKNQSLSLGQIKSAYDLGEVSKKDYLFYKLELLKLKQEVNRYSRNYLVSLSSLNENVDNMQIKEVACNDLVSPVREIDFEALEEHGEIKELVYQESAASSMYKISSETFDSLSYSLEYEKEYEVDRYVLGVSIPLSFATSQKEKQRGAFFHTKMALAEEKDALSAKIQDKRISSSLRLATYYDEYDLLQSEIVPLSEELYKLSEYAYKSGEGSVLESISASRAYQENVLQMLVLKQEYYKEFFDLHIIADLHFGAEHE